jgi:hypothetical protein
MRPHDAKETIRDAINHWNEGMDAELGADLDPVVSASKKRIPRR